MTVPFPASSAARPGCSGCRDDASFDIDFAMAFQPIVDLETGSPFAFEALVRGPDGQSAGSVLARVNDLNRYAFDQACRVKAIETAVTAGIVETEARLSINFLPNAVYSPLACIQLTLRTAERAAFPLDRLIFEFTENEQMASPDHVGAIIETYRSIGFSVAIDDFGAGHAGLGLFARFATDMVKLDMELIRQIDADPRRQAIVRAVVRLCDELGTVLIAEGIETLAEATVLRDMGLRYMQGYLLARPMLQALPVATLPF